MQYFNDEEKKILFDAMDQYLAANKSKTPDMVFAMKKTRLKLIYSFDPDPEGIHDYERVLDDLRDDYMSEMR